MYLQIMYSLAFQPCWVYYAIKTSCKSKDLWCRFCCFYAWSIGASRHPAILPLGDKRVKRTLQLKRRKRVNPSSSLDDPNKLCPNTYKFQTKMAKAPKKQPHRIIWKHQNQLRQTSYLSLDFLILLANLSHLLS